MGTRAVVFGASLVSLAVGAVGGYFYAKYKFEEFYMAQAEDEIADAQRRYREDLKDAELDVAKRILGAESSVENIEELKTFDETTRAFAVLNMYRGLDVDNPEEPFEDDELDDGGEESRVMREPEPEDLEPGPNIPMPRNVNAYARGEDTVNKMYAREVAARNRNRPYVISKDEFFEADEKYTQIQITVYADGAYADSQDSRLITDAESMLGVENLNRFGHFSEDSRIVYIRNERMRIEVELYRSDESYSEIQGLNDDIDPEHEHRWSPEAINTGRSRFQDRRPRGRIRVGDNE